MSSDKFTITPIKLGEGKRPKSLYTYLSFYDDDTTVFYGIFLVRNKDYTIIIDTGTDLENYSRSSGFEFHQIDNLFESFIKYDYSLDKVDLIIQTHLHYDHCSLMPQFKGIRKYLQRKELEYAINPHPLMRSSYVRSYFENEEFKLIDGDCSILPGLDIVFVPGHSPGCQAVLIDTKEGKAALTGFCCISDNFTSKAGFIIPAYHENPIDAYNSTRRLMELADFICPNHSAQLIGNGGSGKNRKMLRGAH